jgi:hypothetical protein
VKTWFFYFIYLQYFYFFSIALILETVLMRFGLVDIEKQLAVVRLLHFELEREEVVAVVHFVDAR